MVGSSRYSKLILVGLWAWGVVSAEANSGLLHFTTTVRQSQGVTIGEVIARDRVIVRFRTTKGAAVGSRAQIVASRLHRQALQGITPDDVIVTGEGSAVQVRVGNNLLVAPDAQTARLSGCSLSSLAAQWAERIAAAFTPPYLGLDLDGELRVPVGESRTVRYGGYFPEVVTAESTAPDIATASVDSTDKMLIVEGKTRGETQVKVTAGTLAGEFEGVCRPWAGQVKTFAEAQITGRDIPISTRRQATVNAILTGITVAPGATASIPQLHGDGRLWKGIVVLEGEGYFRKEQEVVVHHKLIPVPDVPLEQILVSNEPEKVTEPAVLMRQSLPASHSSRVLWHHVNRSDENLTFALRLINTNDVPLRVHILGNSAGPGEDEMYLGHMAMHRFWQALRAAVGYVAVIPAGKAWQVCQLPTRPPQLISGMAQLTNLGDAALLVEVAAEPSPARLPLTTLEPTAADLKLSDWAFTASRHLSVTHTIGGAWTFVHVGKHTDQLPGDYGVVYNIDVEVTNLLDVARHFEIAVMAAGGATRGIYIIRDQLVETRVLRPSQEKVLYKQQVPAGASVSIPIKTIPQSGSNYPVTLVVRSPRR